MKRSTFIKNASIIAIGVTTLGLTAAKFKDFTFDNKLKVNEKRIENRILELSKFGRDDKGRGYRVPCRCASQKQWV